MGEYFSTARTIEVFEVKLLVKPSTYDHESSAWSNAELTTYVHGEEHLTATTKIVPGSDRMKVLASDSSRHVAVMCDSQWYEDLYIFELPSLRKISSFEGVEMIDGASEGFFLEDFFIALPTFSFEGGCGGLRRVSLKDGNVEVILPPSFFSGFRVFLQPARRNRNDSPGIDLPAPFGLLNFTYDNDSGALDLDYVAGRLRIFIDSSAGSKEPRAIEFIARSTTESFQDSEGNRWLIRDDDRNSNWWLRNGPQRALELLRIGSGRADATFREGQEDAIRHIVEGRGRLLVVQKTGWGKSFVYFIATKLLRDAGNGPALLISPLLALMRNQIAAAERMGVRAATINSDNVDDWTQVEARLARGDIDILLISPERLANERFRTQVLAGIAAQISMLVILRLLATTATANNRVMEDLAAVLGPNLDVSRGDLNRTSLSLQTIRLPSQAERLAWLAEQLATLQGHGIIYTLTVRDANQVAQWLKTQGFNVEAYTGETGDRREQLEQALLNNQVKALVATTALGMGYDKPDLAFVIHYQMPGSVVAYYQQVGRAGRALDSAYGVLLSGQEESDITDWFIRSAFPTRQEVADVLGALEDEPNGLSVPELLSRVNLSKGRVDKTIALLSLWTGQPFVDIRLP